jgi:uracil-DNA glycosylase
LIVGLAPGLHGANRTGRPFTGDHAGILLYRTLHTFGYASRPISTSADDGLVLTGCRITNAVNADGAAALLTLLDWPDTWERTVPTGDRASAATISKPTTRWCAGFCRAWASTRRFRTSPATASTAWCCIRWPARRCWR